MHLLKEKKKKKKERRKKNYYRNIKVITSVQENEEKEVTSLMFLSKTVNNKSKYENISVTLVNWY